ncbi:MAG: hypothetical protein ACPHK0_07900 [Dehalococcoidia bacterium]|jgi:hypothetical protein
MAVAKAKTVIVVCVKSRQIADDRYIRGKKYKVPVSILETYPNEFVAESDLVEEVTE